MIATIMSSKEINQLLDSSLTGYCQLNRLLDPDTTEIDILADILNRGLDMELWTRRDLVNAFLRVSRGSLKRSLPLDKMGFKFNPITRDLVTPDNTSVHLQGIRGRLFHELLLFAPAVVSSNRLLECWPATSKMASHLDDNNVAVCIKKLRESIGDRRIRGKEWRYIQSFRFEGYALRPAIEVA